MPTKKELETLNETLHKDNTILRNAVNVRNDLIESLAGYLKTVEEQLLSTVASISAVLESHQTLTAPIPEKTDDGN